MDPATGGTAAERTLALSDRLDALHSELAPLERQYRAWAREYDESGVPHDQDEFAALLDRMHGLKRQVTNVRAVLRTLAAIGGAP